MITKHSTRNGQMGRASSNSALRFFAPAMQAAASPDFGRIVDRSGLGNHGVVNFVPYESSKAYTAGQVTLSPFADGFLYVCRLPGSTGAGGWPLSSAQAATAYASGSVTGANEFSDGTVTWTKIADPFAANAGWCTIVKHPSVTTDTGFHVPGFDWDLSNPQKCSFLLEFEVQGAAPAAAGAILGSGTPGFRIVANASTGGARVVVQDAVPTVIDTGYKPEAILNGSVNRMVVFVDGVARKLYPSINGVGLTSAYGLSLGAVGATLSAGSGLHIGTASASGGSSQSAQFRNIQVYVGNFTLSQLKAIEALYGINPNSTLPLSALV